MQKILCWITVYNQEKQIENFLDELKSFKSDFNLDFVIFNNGSNDKSISYISKSKFKFFNRRINKGVGYSLILSIKYALKNKYNILVQIAGNGKMSPTDIPKMISPIIDNDYDYVTGSRFYNNKNYITTPVFRKISIKILNFIFSFLFKKKISDATCGFKAFKVNILKNKLMNFNKKKFYSYAFEYYCFGKVLISNKIKHCESSVMMRYPKKGKYSHIRPFLDWFTILFGYIQAKLDNKKIFD